MIWTTFFKNFFLIFLQIRNTLFYSTLHLNLFKRYFIQNLESLESSEAV
jgi:hypothetical protein